MNLITLQEGKTSFKEQLKKEKEMEKMVLEERRSSRLPTTAE